MLTMSVPFVLKRSFMIHLHHEERMPRGGRAHHETVL
jgi:hypothetical protein